MGKRYTVRAFGRLAVEDTEGPVALGGPRPRTVLALLLVTDRTVSTDRLVEETWGADPPARARRTLQAYVADLRRSLGGDDGPLHSEAAGYRLDRDQLRLDLSEFESLAHQGREQLALGDPSRAVELLQRALALWTDDPFADLPTDDVPTLAIERTRLSELRMNVVEAHIEARLAGGAARDVIPDLERLVATHPEREGTWRHLMVALHESGRTAEALRAAERCRAFLGTELGLEPGEEIRRLEQRIAAGERLLAADGDVVAGDRPVAVCPYKGLAVYLPEEAALYFGREGLVNRLIARLAERPLVTVVGSSGSGKSSLVGAGLIPALHDGALPGARWEVTFATPGRQPLAALELAAGEPDKRVLVVIDQFEEVFTQCLQVEDRQHFLDRLTAAVREPGGGLKVVIVARADFFGRFAEHPRFASFVSDGTLLVGAMSPDELRRAVVGPAEHVGLTVEPALVEAVVADAGHEPGALPLVSHALVETWARRDGTTLTLAGYVQAGGVVGALAQTAECTLTQQLSPEQQGVARDLLLRLVDPAADGPETRRTASLDELAGASANQEEVRTVIDVMTDARLLTVDDDGVRLTHEALIREWPTLRGWLDRERQGLLVRRQLGEDAGRWERGGRDPADLLGGVRLAAVTDWRERTGLPLTALEAEFLDSSIALADRQRREAEERAAQQARSNRRLRAMVGIVVIAFGVSVALGLVALRQQQRAETNAETATVRQLAAQVDSFRETDLDLALLLSAEAMAFSDRAETRRVLLDTLHEEPRLRRVVPIGAASWADAVISRDGTTLVALAEDGRTVSIISLEDGQPVGVAETLPDPEQTILGPSIAVSPDGSAAAVQQPDGTVHVFNGRTGNRTGVTISHGIASGALAFGPDGEWLAIISVIGPPDVLTTDDDVPTAGLVFADPETGDLLGPEIVVDDFAPITLSAAADGELLVAVDSFRDSVAVWSGRDGQLLSRFFGPEGAGPVTVDDGRVAVVGRNTVRVYDARTGRPLAGALAHPTPASSVAFAPDNHLVTGATDGWRIWDLDGPRQLGPPVTGAGEVNAIVVVDADSMITGNRRGRVVVWGLEPLPLFAQRLPVRFAGYFAPDGSRLVTADPARPGEVAVYQLDPLREEWRVALGSTERHPHRLAWSPDGERIAAVTRSGTVLVLSAADGTAVLDPTPLAAFDERDGAGTQVPTLAFSPDGDRLALGALDGDLVVVTVEPGRTEPRSFEVGRPIHATAFEGDRHVLLGGDDGAVHRIDLDTGNYEPVIRATGPGAIHVLATASGGRVVVGGDGGALSVWRRRDWSRVAQMDAGGAAVRGVALTPDGRWLAASLETGETRLFDITNGAPAGRFGVASSTVAWPHPVGFSADGSSLLSWDNTSIVSWTFDPVRWREAACSMAGRLLTEAERARIFGDAMDRGACGG